MNLTRREVLRAVAASPVLAAPIPVLSGLTGSVDLGFEAAFPRRFFEKRYFGYTITGVSIIAAGAFSYATAGAGAPVAATGVSTVATWVAGGGAGSYMAGLSTIGGWFGGNAMIGAAILNGISLGTVGGVTSFGMLNAGQKALVLTSMAATTLDGVAMVQNPETKQLDWDVRLQVPLRLADGNVKELGNRLAETNEKLADLSQDLIEERRKGTAADSKAPGSNQLRNAASPKLLEIERDFAAQVARRQEIERQILAEVDAALKSPVSASNDVVLAVLAYNLGNIEKFQKLFARIVRVKHQLKRSSYFDYLQAVGALLSGKESQAMGFLEAAWRTAPFALEPPILMINILGRKQFVANEKKIYDIAEKASSKFDADAYASLLTPVSMYYRVGFQALKAKRCDRAFDAFTRADKALSSIQKYVIGKDIRNLIDVGKANALYCNGKKTEAMELFGVALKRTREDEKDLLCKQFAGGCK